MKHSYIRENSSSDHYAISQNSTDIPQRLIQLQKGYSQSRLKLSIEQTEHIITLLQENINKIKNNS